MTSTFDRRRAVTGAAAVAVGAPLLAACGGEDEPDSAGDPAPEETAPSAPEGSSPDDDDADGEALAATSDVPVNGCLVIPSAKVVVTQPSEGDFKAFSATCTHQGCQVSNGSDGVIPCRCHGSQFSLEDGSVVQGPATSDLDEVAINVEGDSITLG